MGSSVLMVLEILVVMGDISVQRVIDIPVVMIVMADDI